MLGPLHPFPDVTLVHRQRGVAIPHREHRVVVSVPEISGLVLRHIIDVHCKPHRECGPILQDLHFVDHSRAQLVRGHLRNDATGGLGSWGCRSTTRGHGSGWKNGGMLVGFCFIEV